MIRRVRVFAVIVTLLGSLALTACGDAEENAGSATSGKDLLSDVMDRGTVVVAISPGFPPGAFLDDAGEFVGFDVDVANEIAGRMGVEIEYTDPAFELITAGNWQGRWDMNVSSLTITTDRAKVLYFSEPYNFTPIAAAVHADNSTFSDPDSLDGATIGACKGCTGGMYVTKELTAPNQEFDFVIDDAELKEYQSDTDAINDLSIGDGTRLDAVIIGKNTLDEAIDKAQKIKIIGTVFNETSGVSVDRGAPLDSESFFNEVNSIIKEMHEDGTLSELSMEWYGVDKTKPE